MGDSMASDVVAVTATYLLWKLLLRRAVGTAPDKRGWGLETYIAALAHQIALVAACAALVLCSYGSLDPWLRLPWPKRRASSLRFERLFCIMQLVEMATDALYLRYPGFGSQYKAHHMFTFLSGVLFMSADGDFPVGVAIICTALLEFGGGCLNLVNLVAQPTPTMYRCRTYAYAWSRLVATVVLGLATRTTVMSWATVDSTSDDAEVPPPPWLAYTFAWLVIGVNLRWVYAMLTAERSTDAMGGFDKATPTTTKSDKADKDR
jgi:hypothetical protein